MQSNLYAGGGRRPWWEASSPRRRGGPPRPLSPGIGCAYSGRPERPSAHAQRPWVLGTHTPPALAALPFPRGRARTPGFPHISNPALVTRLVSRNRRPFRKNPGALGPRVATPEPPRGREGLRWKGGSRRRVAEARPPPLPAQRASVPFLGSPPRHPPRSPVKTGGEGGVYQQDGRASESAAGGGGEGASAASENGRRNGRVGRVENSARRTAAPEAGRTAAGKKEHPFSGRPKAPSPASSSSSSSAELLPFPGLAQVGQRPAETLRLPGLSAEKRSRPRGCV